MRGKMTNTLEAFDVRGTKMSAALSCMIAWYERVCSYLRREGWDPFTEIDVVVLLGLEASTWGCPHISRFFTVSKGWFSVE